MKKESRIIRRERQTALRVDGARFSGNGEFIRARLSHGALKIDVQSADVGLTLSEIRKIVECLNMDEEWDDLQSFELRTLLSEEFMNNSSATDEIRRLLSNEQQYRVVKEMVKATEELDFINRKKSLRLEPRAIKQAVRNLCDPIDLAATRHALIHIKGILDDNDRVVIIDHIHQHIPQARIRAYQTEQDIEGKALIEAIFFGDYGPLEDQ